MKEEQNGKDAVDSFLKISGECAEIDKYTPNQVKRLAYLPATLGSQWPEKISWNRCGKMMTPFDHEEFKGGPITPGHQNDCTRRSFTLEITRFLNKVPLETNVVLECPKVHKRQREDSKSWRDTWIHFAL